jgi:hypothetical protein
VESFLKLVVDHLYSNHGNKIQEVNLIFPGRRAGLFFMKQYKVLVKDKPMWAPPVRTISELISELSDLQVADPIILIFELYKVFCNIRKTTEDFDTFYPFGEMLLNDFDDIDKYLVDTHQLFQNISDLRDIENKFSLTEEQLELIRQFWKNINLFEAGPVKKDFIGIWNQLSTIYDNFKSVLISKGIAYEGMVYRQVCDKIKNGELQGTISQQYAIIGFNALNECEKVFFSYLQKNHLVNFYWDYDQYYVQNNWHEAGFFLRENLDRFPNSITPSNFNNLLSPKEISIVSAPSDIGQAKILPELLKNNTEARIDSETVVVLADEQLLIPVLSSLPAEIKDVNVTLGYPFRMTHVYSFLELMVKLQKNKRNSGGATKFYYRDVLALLNHTYTQIICGVTIDIIVNEIIANNLVFIAPEFLQKNDYLTALFRETNTPAELLNYLKEVGDNTIYGLKGTDEYNESTNFQLDYWFTFLTAINRLKELLDKEEIEIGMPVLFRLLKKVIGGLSTPFKGEPLAGLQVMGVLETRAIDFANVIILSANEGVFPKTESAPSYIPYNLRRGFGLPTIEHQDAIFAYYFYRLIQRAQKVVVTYNSQTSTRVGEMSRFLYQLRFENAFKVNERSIGFSIHMGEENPINIPKNKQIEDYLKSFTNQVEEPRYLTPTALSAYMECSLRFYFRYIAKIKEKEEVSEDIEGSVFGKLLHSAMEDIYRPYIGKVITNEIFETFIKSVNIEGAVIDAFSKVYFKNSRGNETLHGKSILIKEILEKYIKEILKKDCLNSPFTIISLEEPCKMEFNCNDSIVFIGGVIDRLDQINGSVRIIDYKTGNVDFSCPSIESLFNREGDTGKYSAIFQSMLYALVIKQQGEYKAFPVFPGLYGLRKIFSSDFDCSISVNKNKITDILSFKDEYEQQLRGIVSEIFNPKVPFSKTPDKKKCENCAYRGICQR